MNSVRRTAYLFSGILMLSACAGGESVDDLLDNINDILTSSHGYNRIHYSLSYDDDFPCSASLHERWMLNGETWYQRYRFDVHDIQPGTFLLVRDGRRAIIYDGERKKQTGEVVRFKEKKVVAVKYRGELGDQEQVAVLDNMLTAIAACEEKYTFE